MKKRIIIIISILFLGIVAYQVYYYVKHNANTIIIIGNQDNKMNEEMIIFIDDKKVKEFNLRNHFSNIEKQNLSFGNHKITLKGIKSDIIYETTISFYGIFSWNHIEYNDGKFYYDKYYTPPNFE